MSGQTESDSEPSARNEQAPASTVAPRPTTLLPPDVPAPPPAAAGGARGDGVPRGPRHFSFRQRVVGIGLAVTVAAAFAVVATVNSTTGGVRAAWASVFDSATLKVVVTTHSSDAHVQAAAARYSVALTVASENGSEPLSAGGRDAYEIEVSAGGVNVGDMIVTGGATYARLDLRAIDASSYAGEVRSLAGVPPGPVHAVVSALVHDRWVGIDDGAVESMLKRVEPGVAKARSDVKFGNLQGAFTLSFGEAWKAWTSIRQLSSRNGVAEYSIKLPLQHFVATFLRDLEGSLGRDVPRPDLAIAQAELKSAGEAVDRIPAGLEIPMTVFVSNGSLTRLVVTHEGASLDLAVSHPAGGVSAPSKPAMVPAAMARSFLGGFSSLGGTGTGPMSAAASVKSAKAKVGRGRAVSRPSPVIVVPCSPAPPRRLLRRCP